MLFRRKGGATIAVVDEQEWLRRIDGHLETSKGYMREGHELMARIDATLDRNTEAFERSIVAFDRNIEALERNKQAFEQNAGAFLDLRGYLEQVTTVLGALVTEQRKWRKEQREESRVVREALFSILDRLGNQPPPSAA